MSTSMSSVRISGELTMRTVPQRLAEADTWARAGSLDLSGVTQTDSAALSLLLEITRRARSAGQSPQISGLPAQLLALVRFFELRSVLNVTESA